MVTCSESPSQWNKSSIPCSFYQCWRQTLWWLVSVSLFTAFQTYISLPRMRSTDLLCRRWNVPFPMESWMKPATRNRAARRTNLNFPFAERHTIPALNQTSGWLWTKRSNSFWGPKFPLTHCLDTSGCFVCRKLGTHGFFMALQLLSHKKKQQHNFVRVCAKSNVSSLCFLRLTSPYHNPMGIFRFFCDCGKSFKNHHGRKRPNGSSPAVSSSCNQLSSDESQKPYP